MMKRRDFLYSTAATSLVSPFGLKLYANDQAWSDEPHFLIHYSMFGGMDKTYTFDSRPLDMMAKKMQLNYLKNEPKKVQNDTGGFALLADVVNPLMKYKQYFSVINGVMMSPSFDGHNENLAETLAGQPLGGPFYMPRFNRGEKRDPIDFLQLGSGILGGTITDTGGGVNFSVKAAHNLKKKVAKVRDLSQRPKLRNYLARSFNPGTDAKGGFEKSRLLFSTADSEGRRLVDLINGLELPPMPREEDNQPMGQGQNAQAPNTFPQDVDLMISLFKSGMSRSAVFSPDGLNANRNLDAHDNRTAKQSPEIIGTYIEDMAILFKKLSETPYDNKRSMLDVTTVFITSEISRTMRSQFMRDPSEFEKSGTDHNQLTNTCIVGGKGIKGGMIVGSSDLQSAEEWTNGASKAHLSIDADKEKTMARPFDFKNFKERTDKPTSFNADDYLSINSVVNTLLSNAGLDESNLREKGRSGEKYPILKNLLV